MCRVRDPRKLATQYDLVVTTYATLASDYGGKGGNGTRNPLQQVKWHRVVFDEGEFLLKDVISYDPANGVTRRPATNQNTLCLIPCQFWGLGSRWIHPKSDSGS
jgi:hypothetical protein